MVLLTLSLPMIEFRVYVYILLGALDSRVLYFTSLYIYIYMYNKRYREERIKIRINSTVVISKITIRLPASEISSRKR